MIYHSRDEWFNLVRIWLTICHVCLIIFPPQWVKHQNLVQQLQIFSQRERDCWEGKVLKDDGKWFMLTVMWTLQLEMKGGGKVPNHFPSKSEDKKFLAGQLGSANSNVHVLFIACWTCGINNNGVQSTAFLFTKKKYSTFFINIQIMSCVMLGHFVNSFENNFYVSCCIQYLCIPKLLSNSLDPFS